MTTIDPAAEVQETPAFPLPTPARFAVLRTGGNLETIWYQSGDQAVGAWEYEQAQAMRNAAQERHSEYAYHLISLNEAVQAYLDQQRLAEQPDMPFALPLTTSWAILRTHAREATYWIDRLDGSGKDVRDEQSIRDRAAQLTRDHGNAGYTYEPVNLNVLLRAHQNAGSMVTDQTAQVTALTAQVATLTAERDEANRRVQAEQQQKRADLTRIQNALQELAGEENTFDAEAYNSWADEVNQYLSWPMDHLERDFTVTSRVTINVSIPVYVRTTVTASDEEQATRMVQDDPSSYIDHSDVECELTREVREHWDGDWDFDQVDDVEEQ